jgi:VanZ family protein
MKRKLLILPWLLYSGLIYIVSSHSLERLPRFTIFGWDKVIHMTEYAVYSFLAAIALEAFEEKDVTLNKLVLAFIITALFGASDEIHQLFVAGRSASVFDFIADLIGGMIGLFLFKKLNITDKLQHVDFKKT